MKPRGTLLCILSTLAFSAVRVRGLNCTAQERAYPPNICLTVSNVDLLSQSTGCPFELVTMVNSEQYDTLTRYAEVLFQSGSLYWTGYRYNASNVLVNCGNVAVPAQSPVLDTGNYASSPQSPRVEGVCIAIGLDGSNEAKLFRRNCSVELGYIRSESVDAPTVSLMTSVSRFLSQGSSITLTCSVTNTVDPVLWRRRSSEEVTADTPGVTINDAMGTLTIASFDGVTVSYECVASNRAGSVVSQSVVLMDSSGGGSVGTAPIISQLSPTSTSAQFGTSVNLTCSFSAVSRVEWFVNGILQQNSSLTGTETGNVFVVNSFSEDGMYQCRVFNQNGDNSVESVFISGRAGTPGLVEFPISIADTQSQVSVSWLYPANLNVLDPILLHYDLYYQQGTSFDESTATRIPNVPPLLLNGEVSPVGVVQRTLNGLEPGTTYTITIQAVSSASSGELRGDRVIVTTLGIVPTGSVDNSLKVLRTKDNKTLFADWDDFKTAPPTGQVARYWVDYRDSGKEEAINSVVLDPKYSYLVISPVEDAQKYQVRVRVGVITKRDPLTYSYSPFSKWVEVQGITVTVPPVPPTQPLRVAVEIVATAVIVPVLVILLVLIIVGVGITCYCLKRSKNNGYNKGINSQEMDSPAVSFTPKDSSIDLKLPEKDSSPII